MHVLITGVASRIGRLVAERLVADPGVATVTGLDARVVRPPLPGMRFVRARLHQPEWTALLDTTDVVVHVAGLIGWPLRRRIDTALVADTRQVLRAVESAAVPRLVVVNNATVYGPQPVGPLHEDARIRGHQAGAYARDRALVSDFLDLMADRAGDRVITRLRTAWVCGPRYVAPVRHFRRGPVLVCGCEARLFQVVHEEDLCAAILLAVGRDLPGIYNVSADSGVTFHELAALLGDNRTCVPLAWATLMAWWRWRWLGRRTPPGWLRTLYRCQPVDTSKLRATGWTPLHSSRETLLDALAALDAQ
ncbi:MAG: NAD-dependent epimerase/dehydratase family protein [Chloroflexi bacterium]|nr:NAD-dependent epimerase/dehydratase family protein [Chloroflexota bacterium]